MSYNIYDHFYVSASAFVYPQGNQEPWNPDFIYSFGYFNWRDNTFSIQYNNYAGNSFPWKEGTAGFLDGSLSISWHKSF